MLGLLIFGVLLAGVDLSFPVTLFVILFGSTMLFFLPNLYLGLRRDRRRAEIRAHLPDSIDLLEICVSSGMGLDMAWNSVAEEMRPVSTTFADEMELTNLEISLGVPRNVAMQHMAERTGAEDLSSLVALLSSPTASARASSRRSGPSAGGCASPTGSAPTRPPRRCRSSSSSPWCCSSFPPCWS